MDLIHPLHLIKIVRIVKTFQAVMMMMMMMMIKDHFQVVVVVVAAAAVVARLNVCVKTMVVTRRTNQKLDLKGRDQKKERRK